jgi:hypothetical protein
MARVENYPKGMTTSIKHWKLNSRSGTAKILRVLITAAVGEAIWRQERIIPAGTCFPEYFIRCDAGKAELLFGREFKTLLETVRKGGQSVSQIYDKLNNGENLRKGKQTEQGGQQKKRQK